MPIEFRCTQCQRLLRTQDDAAGKQAKCPECGTLLVVPTPESGAADVPPPLEAGSENPFAFSRPSGSAAQNPYQSPADYLPGPLPPGAIAGPIVHSYIDVGDCLRRTWTIFQNQYWLALGVFFATWLLNMAVNFGGGIASAMVQASRPDPVVVNSVQAVVQIGSYLFSTWLSIGAALCYLRISRGQPTSVGEVFSGGPYFLRILGATLLFMLAIWAIAFICILPAMGVAWAVATNLETSLTIFLGLGLGAAIALVPITFVMLGLSQFYYLILDQDLGVFESFSISWKVAQGNRLTLFAIWTLASIVGLLVTLLTCGLGGFFLVFPFVMLLMPVIYLAMTGQPTADQLYWPKS